MFVRLKLIAGGGLVIKVDQLPEGLSPSVGMTICVNDDFGRVVGEFKVNKVEVCVGPLVGEEGRGPRVTLHLEAPVGFTTADWNRFVLARFNG